MIRICLFVALAAGLAVAGLNIFKIKEKVTTLISQRDTEHNGRVQAEGDLATTRNDLEITNAFLKVTLETLATTSAERDNAVNEKEAQVKRATELADSLQKTTQERDDARANLFAYTQSGLSSEQVAGVAKQLKQLQDTLEVSIEEKNILSRSLAKATNELARLLIVGYPGPALPARLKGKVIVADPKWDFVVLDVGEDQGILEYGELLVSRNGRLVAKVQVRTVEKSRSIANVVPGWALNAVMEGDEVTPAHPAS